jgi:hypothetical protein
MTTATASRLVAAGYQPCPAPPAPAPQGTPVWSARLEWSLASGTMIRARYGVGGGDLGQPATLTVRKAAGEYICCGCRHVIARGALHGSNAGVHYCACCITTDRPEDQFKTKAAC